VDDLITAFLGANTHYAPETRRLYTRFLRECAAILGVARWQDVTAADMDRYIAALAQRGDSYYTRRTKYGILRSFARYLATRRIHLPIEGLPTLDGRKKPITLLTQDDIVLLLRQPVKRDLPKRKRDAALLHVLWGTALTPDGIISLTLSDYDGTTLRVKGRPLPLYPTARQHLDHYLAEGRPRLVRDPTVDSLFLTLQGKQMLKCDIATIVRHYGERAGIQATVTPQALRHSFAMYLLYQGTTPTELNALLGGTLDTPWMYARLKRSFDAQGL